MDAYQKVLFIDCETAFYKIKKFKIGDFFGPVDLGLHLAGRYNSLNIGTGLLAGSVFPGSNRLIFNGFSPCWGGFYISSMGGAGLVFDNLGINMLSLIGKASVPSIMYLNRTHGEEIQIEILPVDVRNVWREGRGGIYSLMTYALNQFGEHYETDPRILVVGPAAEATDFGAIASVPIKKGKLSHVDTWAGRGGFGSKMLKEHGIAAVIYGGTYIDEDFRDRKVADQWFENKYQKKMSTVDLEATTKYRFEANFDTGGTFGVNYATVGGRVICFNYKSIYMDEDERRAIHDKFIVNHYLKQFNEETIKTQQYRNCGEPCAAVCKKMHGEYKKDYEPYQTMGPLTGIFDQRAAEKLNQHANMYGFDAISVGGVISWLMECLSENLLELEELGINGYPVFSLDGFDMVSDSMHNAEIGIGLLDTIIEKRGIINLEQGARKFVRRLSREKGKGVLDSFLYTAFARRGWMVPNQYWTPGTLSPMPIMGKYYMYYGNEFLPPRELGRRNAKRMQKELSLDNIGMCRFHRLWAEEMIPEIMDSLYGLNQQFLENISMTASRINSRNSSIYWEPERNIDFVHSFLERLHTVEGNTDSELMKWLQYFKKDKHEAALSFWYEMHKGILESLREF
ncbi:MAG: aldehyde ferredoxin oxidoreductase N-terminal domain-containing protein [Desulfobacteraceae bacterium]|jgi:glyceraldehyde-3-phosphate dehydrogenase (ferredoxin)